jgi:hypothetical protein
MDVNNGRIGSRGRTVRYVAGDEAEARKIIRHCLQRRPNAPKRMGVGYQLRELIDPARWVFDFYRGVVAATDDCMRSAVANGKITVNAAPLPCPLSASIAPPCALTIHRQMLRPRPQPPELRATSA